MTLNVAPPAHHLQCGSKGHRKTPNFGSELRSVKKYNIYLPYLHLVPLLGMMPSEFHQDLWLHKTRVDSTGYCAVLFTR